MREDRWNILTEEDFSTFDKLRKIRNKGVRVQSRSLLLLPRQSSSSVPVWWAQVKGWPAGQTPQTWTDTPAEPVCKHFYRTAWPFVRLMLPSIILGNFFSGQSCKDRRKRREGACFFCKSEKTREERKRKQHCRNRVKHTDGQYEKNSYKEKAERRWQNDTHGEKDIQYKNTESGECSRNQITQICFLVFRIITVFPHKHCRYSAGLGNL